MREVDFVKLEKIMKDQGRRQNWLAVILNESPMQINHYFRGRRKMSPESIPVIAKTLGVTMKSFTK